MLNPLAHDFTPISAFPIEPSSTPPTPKAKKKEQKKKQPETKSKSKNATPLAKAEHVSKSQKNKESRTNNKKYQQQQSRLEHNRRKSTQPIQPSLDDMFEKESKFITIEAAIDPIHRIDPANTTLVHNNVNNRKSSIASEKYLLEHGYERYIDWVSNSDTYLTAHRYSSACIHDRLIDHYVHLIQ
jgi:hypothetical protein